jgi:hypothetical protein
MIARCMVEVGTSSYYSALHDSVKEPVLKEICRKIAADEIRHYGLFFMNLGRYIERDQVGFWRRLRVALRRIAEAEDDELAYAYYAANETSHPYDRRRYSRAYARRALALYQEHHVRRMTALVFRAVGLSPHTRLARAASRVAWNVMRYKVTHLARVAA